MYTAMKYPPAVEKYTADILLEFGPLADEAYEAGLKGEGGFPLDLDEVRRDYAETSHIPLKRIQRNFFITGAIQWANEAYARGCRESKRQH